MGLRIPLHLDPKNRSSGAMIKRLELHMAMRQMAGGKGFRQVPTSKKGAKAITKLKSKQPSTREEFLMQFI